MNNNNNYCIIMGGGIGSRFWPMSRQSKPKQFLDFFGTGRTLLQMTFDRFSRFIPIENIRIATNELYAAQVLEQLPELNKEQILLEPLRLNTAPSIAYACFHIAAQNPNANIIVAPSDHLILGEEAFTKTALEALEFVGKNNVLLTFGVKPTRPETGYGYIQAIEEGKDKSFLHVKTFIEKPNAEMAQILIETGGFYWNSGMFFWNAPTILNAIDKYLPEVSALFKPGQDQFGTAQERAFIEKTYPYCPSISIDYGVMEKADNVMIMPVDIGWTDLGSWMSLYELGKKDAAKNAVFNSNALFYEASGNVVCSSGKKLLVVQGIDDCIIAEHDNAILICRKGEEQRIKQFVTDIGLDYGDKYN